MSALRTSNRVVVPRTVVSLAFVLLLFSTHGYAQEIGVAGTVADATGGVLPGVIVTAVHTETSTTFSTVTDSSGAYSIPGMRSGTYTVTAALDGFATVTTEDLALTIGQRAVLDLTMPLSTVSENVTVSGVSPQLDFVQSRVSGVINSRQMEDIPINGRNWMELTMLLPGARRNDRGDSAAGNLGGAALVTMDGQQVSGQTSYLGGMRQPKFSRETIAEFEQVSARFDATKGKSQTVQVNTVSKSGTNIFAGSGYGFFRHDSMDAADHVAGIVLPYQNQQVGTTLGGPMIQDKAHFFAHFEYEREPRTVLISNPVFAGNVPDSLLSKKRDLIGGLRVDLQINPNRRLLGRWNIWNFRNPIRNSFGAGTHPSRASQEHTQTGQGYAKLTQVFGNNSLLEVGGGISYSLYDTGPSFESTVGFPKVTLVGYSMGASEPLEEHERRFSVRADYSTFRGGHELKLGGEWQLPEQYLLWPSNFAGTLATNLLGSEVNPDVLFPVWDDPSTWDYEALSLDARNWTQAFGDPEPHCIDPDRPANCRRQRPEYGFFIQDNWRVTNDLTLNLGVRWDFALDAMANDFVVIPLKPTISPQEWTNFQPRLGFAYSATPKTVIRGGFGKYVGGTCDCYSQTTARALAIVDTLLPFDGRANFGSDPYNVGGGGSVPTYESVLVDIQSVGQTLPGFGGVAIGHLPFSYQTSIGFQQELAAATSLQVDYVWVQGQNQRDLRNVNIAFDPATGKNYPWSTKSNRPYPNFGALRIDDPQGYSNQHSLDFALNQRFSNGFQASLTYSLSGYKNWQPDYGIFPGCEFPYTAVTAAEIPMRICDRPVDLVEQFAANEVYGAQTATDGTQTADQRHRLVFNGIVDLPGNISISGLYLYGSGEVQQDFVGVDLDDAGKGAGGIPIELLDTRVWFDGTVLPRNGFRGLPIHRVDIRIQERLPLGNMRADLIFEVFNLLNHANFGKYQMVRAIAATFGNPTQNLNSAYTARRMQLGFRFVY